MPLEALEWLEIPDEETPRPTVVAEQKAVLGKRCPQCGWLCEEQDVECFRCGYDFTQDRQIAELFRSLGMRMPKRIINRQTNLAQALRRQAASEAPIYDLRLQAEELALARGFDELICLDDVKVEQYEHQLQAALRSLQHMRGRVILADEVGLGKTIEAGLVMKDLVERGLAQSVLVLCPSSLCEQWREELETKFREAFRVVRHKHQWEGATKIIASMDYAKRKNVAPHVLERDWDLLIVDEAHKLKNRSTQLWKFVNRIRKRYALLLTATPVSNNLMELYSLITILKPGQLGTARAFKRQFCDRGDPRIPRHATQLRRLLSDVMIRNRRSKVNITLPQRQAAIFHLELPRAERELYDAVTEYIREEFQQRPEEKYLRLSLLTLQKELCSSPQAVAGTLRRMAADTKGHSPETCARLADFAALAEQIPSNRKTEAVLELLREFPGQLLVFTAYLPTLQHVLRRITEAGEGAVGFHGGLAPKEKEQAVRAFRQGRARVMVSTESGAEGRNLQFCHMLVNFDLPWNPMRVEQRIGRLHRLGQKNPVTIFNFSTKDTIDARILELLARKIRMFELVIGELDLILGAIDDRRGLEQILTDIWRTSKDDQELDNQLDELSEKIEAARAEYKRVKEAGAVLSDLMEA